MAGLGGLLGAALVLPALRLSPGLRTRPPAGVLLTLSLSGGALGVLPGFRLPAPGAVLLSAAVAGGAAAPALLLLMLPARRLRLALRAGLR